MTKVSTAKDGIISQKASRPSERFTPRRAARPRAGACGTCVAVRSSVLDVDKRLTFGCRVNLGWTGQPTAFCRSAAMLLIASSTVACPWRAAYAFFWMAKLTAL